MADQLMSGQPRVLLDVGPLGMGYAAPRMQAGIYRVVERTLALWPRSELAHLGLSCTASWVLDRAGEAQLAALHPELSSAWVPAHHRLAGADARWAALITRARCGTRLSPVRLLAALGLRGANRLNRPCPLTGEWDIVHSFCDPIPGPERVRARARALTVYDLTTLSHPHFHLPVTISSVNRAIASLLSSGHGWAACISDHTRNELVRRTGFPRERAVVVPLGVDPCFAPAPAVDRAAVRERYAIGHQPYLLCLSSMEPRKNLSGALRGFARYCALNRGVSEQLLLAGPAGWLNAPIAAEIRASGVPVRHLGFIPDRDLPALYSGASGFLYPSHAEGFGLPVLEAMACGTPVLASRTTSLPEVAGDAAVLVDPDDPGAIAEGIGRLLREGDDLSARGRRRAAGFTWKGYSDALHEFHRHMAGA